MTQYQTFHSKLGNVRVNLAILANKNAMDEKIGKKPKKKWEHKLPFFPRVKIASWVEN